MATEKDALNQLCPKFKFMKISWFMVYVKYQVAFR